MLPIGVATTLSSPATQGFSASRPVPTVAYRGEPRTTRAPRPGGSVVTP